MEDSLQHGMSTVGQSIGVLDKLEDCSKIGSSNFVTKGSNWAVFLWQAETGWHQPWLPTKTSASPHEWGWLWDFQRPLDTPSHQRFLNDAVIEQEGRSLLENWYKIREWIGVNNQLAQLLVTAGASEGSVQGHGLFRPQKGTEEAGWEWITQVLYTKSCL